MRPISCFNQACLLCSQYASSSFCTVCLNDAQQAITAKLPLSHENLAFLAQIKNKSAIDSIYGLGFYEWPLENLIKIFKFEQKSKVGLLLADWLKQSILQRSNKLPNALIAVPMPAWKYFKRGYNQAQILTEALSSTMNIKDMSHFASRSNAFKSQHALNRATRLARELKFTCQLLPDEIKHIAIVDDVFTTGATTIALAEEIKRHHPNMIIDVWVMAITKPPNLSKFAI